jgi:hypothetical protein
VDVWIGFNVNHDRVNVCESQIGLRQADGRDFINRLGTFLQFSGVKDDFVIFPCFFP